MCWSRQIFIVDCVGSKQTQEMTMHSHFIEQQARERIDGFASEASQHRLAKRAGTRPDAANRAVLQGSRRAVSRLVHFVGSIRRPRPTVTDSSQAR